MATPIYSEAALLDALGAVGVVPGDTVVMHSSLLAIGRLDGVPLAEMPRRIVDAIRRYLGREGTLAVPASNWDYGRKREPFDLSCSPVTKALGVLSQCVTSLPEARRSPNPIFSVAAVGPNAEEICEGGTASAMGPDSAWDRLCRLDATNLFLGCDLTYLSFVRYIEAHCSVPYLYNKLFDVPVLDDGRPLDLTVVTPLRYAHCAAEHDISRFEQRLREAGVLRESRLGGGPVMAVGMLDCLRQGVEALKEDIHYFLTKPPDYVPGMVPLS